MYDEVVLKQGSKYSSDITLEDLDNGLMKETNTPMWPDLDRIVQAKL